MGDHIADGIAQLIGGKRLQQIVFRTITERAFHIIKVIIGAEDDDGKQGNEGFGFAYQRNAVHFGHGDVGNEKMHRMNGQKRKHRCRAGGGQCDFKTKPFPIQGVPDP